MVFNLGKTTDTARGKYTDMDPPRQRGIPSISMYAVLFQNITRPIIIKEEAPFPVITF